MAGVVFAAGTPETGNRVIGLSAGCALLAGAAALRGRIGGWYLGRWYVLTVMLAWGCAGLAAGWWQLVKAPAAFDWGTSVELQGTIADVDGRIDDRL